MKRLPHARNESPCRTHKHTHRHTIHIHKYKDYKIPIRSQLTQHCTIYFCLYQHLLACSIGARTFPARSFPPDGTTFGQITLGQKLTKEIQPYSYWNMQFYQSEPAYVKFDYTIPRGASIGVYGRRNALPTHTQYHFKEVLSGFSASTRTARAAHVSSHRSSSSSSSIDVY